VRYHEAIVVAVTIFRSVLCDFSFALRDLEQTHLLFAPKSVPLIIPGIIDSLAMSRKGLHTGINDFSLVKDGSQYINNFNFTFWLHLFLVYQLFRYFQARKFALLLVVSDLIS